MDKVNSFLTIHQGIYDNLKFADSKAIAISAINIAIIGGLNALSVFDRTKFELFTLALLAFLALTIAIASSVWVLYPRGSRTQNKVKGRLCDPMKIVEISLDEFNKNIQDCTEEVVLNELAILIYDRSISNQKKYFWLNLEIRFSLIGWAFSLLVLFLKVFE